ncbi:bifunctional adenosylcobinamide kinase/adenosylcobinamide-phosphate guanylyltransferase [Rhizorhapis suberifaciens]|uniref:Bifunctional adenosylcobalamin biosynthesis protein n=1 Tax=Rhizorhapis suberifaciens TaxID=13656 RepID=A0A840HQH9_9SPHN|nr:bifunctional adenosylcobinamide kinase/adenosylcobinamide-phosphate guanylyltransferase [Rhizorhapis suberifaciens]MBB4640123.1 adenosylcobinamide kinase/adenosylcobinamide-phosphate guanylyltransferase [Rhizorhapis suberifaciens]
MKNSIKKTTLVLGGARSGKSRFAQNLAENEAGRLVYVATAGAHDAEMEDRIVRHRMDRGERWETVEEQTDLAGVIEAHGGTGKVLLVDCLTLWLSNLMLAELDLTAARQRLVQALQRQAGQVIFVSNEVGSGIVPETPLGRAFRDEAGRLNQLLAAEADAVALVVAGLPLWLKGERGRT